MIKNLAKQLAGFYRDLNGSFKGYIMNFTEMDKKGGNLYKFGHNQMPG